MKVEIEEDEVRDIDEKVKMKMLKNNVNPHLKSLEVVQSHARHQIALEGDHMDDPDALTSRLDPSHSFKEEARAQITSVHSIINESRQELGEGVGERKAYKGSYMYRTFHKGHNGHCSSIKQKVRLAILK